MSAPSDLAARTPVASVIVPSAGRPAYLRHALQGLAAQALVEPFEVLVAHDGPDPETEAVVSELAERLDVRYVRPQGASGPNAARNRGLRAARSDLLVLVDDDVELPPGWLGSLLEAAREHPEADVIGGPIELRVENPRLRLEAGGAPTPISQLDLGSADHEVEAVWSGNMLLRRRALERAGPFDEAAVYGQEEVEWQRRVVATGGRVRYAAAARLVHRRAPEDATLRSLVAESWRRGRQMRRSDHAEGTRRPLAAELRTVAGCVWHTARHRSHNGILLTAHALGRLLEGVRSR